MSSMAEEKKPSPWYKAPVLMYITLAGTFFLLAIVLIIYLVSHTPHWVQ